MCVCVCVCVCVATSKEVLYQLCELKWNALTAGQCIYKKAKFLPALKTSLMFPQREFAILNMLKQENIYMLGVPADIKGK